MSSNDTARMQSEDILRAFHRRHAGSSPLVFGRGRMEDGRTSYAWLASVVDEDGGPAQVLDLGCGDGSLLDELVRRGHEATGADMSPDELAVARRRLGGRARLVETRAQELPFDDASFDVVLSHMALMLMDDLERVLDEIGRVLRPGGTVAVVIARKRSVEGAAKDFFATLHSLLCAEGVALRFGDPRMSDPAASSALLARFGVVAVEESTIWVEVPESELARFFSAAYYAVDMLSCGGRDELLEWVDARRARLAPDGIMRWPFGARRLVARGR